MRKTYVQDELVEKSTGEISKTTKYIDVYLATPDEFCIIYFSFAKRLLKMKSVVDMRVLFKLCMIAEFDTTRILMPAPIREEVAKELNLSLSHIANVLSRLQTQGFIYGGRGVYELNPFYFWRGKHATRAKLMKESKQELRIKFKMPADGEE